MKIMSVIFRSVNIGSSDIFHRFWIVQITLCDAEAEKNVRLEKLLSVKLCFVRLVNIIVLSIGNWNHQKFTWCIQNFRSATIVNSYVGVKHDPDNYVR